MRDLNERKVFSVMSYTAVYHCFKRYCFCTDTFICGFSFFLWLLLYWKYLDVVVVVVFFNKHSLKHELHITVVILKLHFVHVFVLTWLCWNKHKLIHERNEWCYCNCFTTLYCLLVYFKFWCDKVGLLWTDSLINV